MVGASGASTKVGVGVGEWNFHHSFLKLEHQQALSSQIIQCFSNVALFVQVSEGDAFVSRRAFVSEGVAKAAGFRRDNSIGAMRQHQALKRIVSS